MDRETLVSFAEKIKVDLLGVAPVARFDGVAKEKDPRTIFPETESVIVVGRRITRGSLRGSEEGTNFHGYRMYGYQWLNDRFLAMATFQLASFLEDNGCEAVPLPGLPSDIPAMGVPVRKDAAAPNVLLDVEDAAVRAELGEIGACGFFLSPEFGPRQRFQLILTDATLDGTPMFEGRICLGETCGAVCPHGALGKPETRKVCGKSMAVGKADAGLCRRCMDGSAPNAYYGGAAPDRLGALCARTCVENLEKAGKLENKFVNRFRKRPAWTRQMPPDDPFSVVGR